MVSFKNIYYLLYIVECKISRNHEKGGFIMKAEKLIYILAFTMVLSSMSATMFNIVLPEMSKEFHLSYSQVSWVSAFYLLIYAVGSVVYGKLADIYKLKSLLTFGLLLLCVGSIIGLVSQAYWMVLLGRILQATGAAVVPATAMLVPSRYIPAERRGWAFGITATGLAIGGVIGPIVSALLVSIVHWRWLFCIPLLLLVTLPFYHKLLGEEKGQNGTLDWIGGGLLGSAIACLLLSVTTNEWALLLASVILLLLFTWRIRTSSTPFISPRLFKNKSYSIGLVVAVVAMGVGYSMPFLTPLMLADLNELSPGWIGFVMVPAAAASALFGRKAGKLADTKGNAALFRIASGLLVLCFTLLSVFVGLSPALIALFLICGSVGQMFVQIALSNTISLTLSKEQAGVGMGMLSMLNFLSGAIATGIYSKVVDIEATFRIVPFSVGSDSFIYSNIYFVLIVLSLVVFVVYWIQFGGERSRKTATEK